MASEEGENKRRNIHACKTAVTYDTYANLLMATVFIIGILNHENFFILAASYIGVFGIIVYFLNVAEYMYQVTQGVETEKLRRLKRIAALLNHLSLVVFMAYLTSIFLFTSGVIQ